MLTQERLMQKVNYDPDSGVFTWKKGRGPAKEGSTAGRPHNRGYTRIAIDYKDYLAHRLAWLYVHGEWPRDEIDHINGDKKDNRIKNLRQATRTENCRNVKVHKRNRLGIKGVTERDDCIKRFSAHIMIEGKVLHLGRYETAEEAKAAYNEAALRHHGEFFKS